MIMMVKENTIIPKDWDKNIDWSKYPQLPIELTESKKEIKVGKYKISSYIQVNGNENNHLLKDEILRSNYPDLCHHFHMAKKNKIFRRVFGAKFNQRIQKLMNKMWIISAHPKVRPLLYKDGFRYKQVCINKLINYHKNKKKIDKSLDEGNTNTVILDLVNLDKSSFKQETLNLMSKNSTTKNRLICDTLMKSILPADRFHDLIASKTTHKDLKNIKHNYYRLASKYLTNTFKTLPMEEIINLCRMSPEEIDETLFFTKLMLNYN